MKYFTIIALPTVLFGLVGSYALPISRLRNRQELNLELCANPEAVLDPGCWDLINIPDYLNNPNTGWNHTIPICADSTKCCTDDDTGWSTCFLRLAQKGAGEDCTTTSDEHCQSGKTLAPDLHPDIVASVRVTVESIYGVQGFFRTYYQSLQDAFPQALSTTVSITEYFDPKKESQTTIFAVLGALSVGLAFLTAPTVGAALVAAKATDTVKWAAQSAAISVSQAPGVGRSLWPSGTDSSTIYQIGELQKVTSDITEALSSRIAQALGLLMTDSVTFAAFADHGKYIEKGPPLNPNEIKNALALSLQTYLTSESMSKNGWYAVPRGITTKEEYDNRLQVTCVHPRGLCPSENNHLNIYWSPLSGRQYELGQHDVTKSPAAVLHKLAEWVNVPVLFDGAYNCTKIGRRDDPELIHVNFDGTLDTSCISQLPIVRKCRTPCPEYEPDGSCRFPLVQDCKADTQSQPLVRGGTADQQWRQNMVKQQEGRPQSENDAEYYGPLTNS